MGQILTLYADMEKANFPGQKCPQIHMFPEHIKVH